MSPITLIRASAGSGKTHRITAALVELIDSGAAAPGDVVATTFTVKAAGELRARIRGALLERGRTRAARHLDRALIGTVHAVCQRLLARHALGAGRSPVARIVPEEELADAGPLRRVLHRALDERGERRMAALARRLDIGDFRTHVVALAELLRMDRLRGEQVATCRERSLATLWECAPFDTRPFSFERVAGALRAATAAIADPHAAPVTLNSDTAHALADLLAGVEEGRFVPLALIAHGTPLGKKPDPLLAAARAACADWHASGELRETIAEYVTGCFDLAAATCRAWEEVARAERIADFTDLEVGAVELLEDEATLAAIAGSISALVVDEFQDTNPIQLALFGKLVDRVPHVLWVGDPKQAIYGFRHTDPELVSRAYDALAARGAQLEVLPCNWRSRQQLVRFTSELFAETFAGAHLPDAERMDPDAVRLIPKRGEPPGLPSPAVRVWRVAPGAPRTAGSDRPDTTRQNMLAAIATAIAERLEHAHEHAVVDKTTNAPRPLRPGDVAVVMRTTSHCQDLAAALHERGIPATAETPGLLDTLEGRAALCGLIVATHRNAPLEVAELDYLLGDREPDAWLEDLLRHGPPRPPPRATARADETPGRAAPPDPEACGDEPLQDDGALHLDVPHGDALHGALHGEALDDVEQRDGGAAAATLARLAALRGLLRLATPGEALDAVIAALRLPERCRAAGMQGVRLANLQQLRELATQYEQLRASRRLPATAAGLCRHLLRLEAEDRDTLALGARDAVTVLTCHKAKGLEWPLVVVAMLDGRTESKHRLLAGTGLHVEGGGGDPADPLSGRWARFWVHPFGDRQRIVTASTLGAALEQAPESVRARAAIDREDQRLLYVALTRARDVLVLPLDRDAQSAALWDLAFPHAPLPQQSCDDFAGTGVPVEVETIAARPPAARPVAPGVGWTARAGAGGPRARRAVGFSAWEHDGARALGAVHALGGPIPLRAPSAGGDARALGVATHAFLAADLAAASPQRRLAMAARLLRGHGVGALAPDALLLVADRLRDALARLAPGARSHREWPLALDAGGQLVRGRADLLLHRERNGADGAPGGWWVVDHKTLRAPPGPDELLDHARQIAGYARALQAAVGEPVHGGWIHLPIQAQLVEVTLPDGVLAAS